MIRQKKYITGDYMEIEIFNTPEHVKPFERQKRVRESTPAQKNLNSKKAMRYFVRLVHCNFTKKDLYVDLTYDKENIPESKEEILRDIRNYINRLKRWRKKQGLSKLKYIYVISNTDNSGNKVRYHVHMIINDMNREVAEQKWGKGFVNTDRLQFTETGVTGKSLYMARQAKGDRSWNSSIGLVKPEAVISDKKITKSIARQMQNAPDDRRFFEKLYNTKAKPGEWIFTDCQIEEDGRQLVWDNLVPENDVGGMGVSFFIRMRRYPQKKARREKV